MRQLLLWMGEEEPWMKMASNLSKNSEFIRAMSSENLLEAFANIKGADQPAHLQSVIISVFIVCY